MSESRTSKSFKNANIALIFYIIGLFLNFISRKVFIDHLGVDILGLNTIAVNLLSFLNLAELGIGAAVSYSLYKPLHNNDRQSIREIITVQGYFYRRIAYIVIAASCVLMLFFPLIFQKSNLPLWYAYSTFGVLLLGSLMSYIWNYKQILLTADQKQYKIIISQHGMTFVKVFFQIIAILYFKHNAYIAWLVLEFLFAVINTFVLSYVIKKEYNWLTINLQEGKELLKKHKEIIHKTKQLFFHRVGGFVLSQTSPIIIYSYATLSLVASYGNYVLIVTGLLALLNAIFNSMSAGVGNLVAQGERDKIIQVFWELFSFRFFVVAVSSVTLFYLADPFIILWVGEEYLLSKISLILIIATFYINTLRTIVDSFIQAYGLFRDIWATITESCLNLVLSVLLGYYYGINGVLLGVFISLLFMVHTWKPYFLFTNGLQISFAKYIRRYTLYLFTMGLLILFDFLVFDTFDKEMSIWQFLLKSVILLSANGLFLGLLMFIFVAEFRSFLKRLQSVVVAKLKIATR